MSLTEEQLDAIEAVKGKRNPALWDPRCQQYMANKSKTSSKNAVKVDSTSSVSYTHLTLPTIYSV